MKRLLNMFSAGLKSATRSEKKFTFDILTRTFDRVACGL